MKKTETPKGYLCGWCAGASMSAEHVRKQHARCRSTDELPCVCAQNGHKLNTELAQRMANNCHCSIERVYAKHGQRQRVVSDERRAQLAEQLVRARAARRAS